MEVKELEPRLEDSQDDYDKAQKLESKGILHINICLTHGLIG